MGTLQIDGDTVYLPSDADVSAPSQPWPLDERISLSSYKVIAPLSLLADGPIALALDGLSVNALRVQTNNPITMRITTAAGTTQVIPVDPLAVIVSLTVPITAIDFTRQSGVATEVVVSIGAT